MAPIAAPSHPSEGAWNHCTLNLSQNRIFQRAVLSRQSCLSLDVAFLVELPYTEHWIGPFKWNFTAKSNSQMSPFEMSLLIFECVHRRGTARGGLGVQKSLNRSTWVKKTHKISTLLPESVAKLVPKPLSYVTEMRFPKKQFPNNFSM